MDTGRDALDLGRDHTLTITWWDPDLALNPQHQDIAGQLPAKVGALIRHSAPDGQPCGGHITFDTSIARRTTDGPFWNVESWEPLTLSPSVLCNCGDHGYIRGARWIPA